jgi:hypothetical protein
MGTANFGIAGLITAARQLGPDEEIPDRALRDGSMAFGALCMYDENVRYLTGTLTPGWNRPAGPAPCHAVRDGAPILFEQGDLGFQIERHSPWIRRTSGTSLDQGCSGPASTQQVNKFTKALLQAMKENGVTATSSASISSTST